MTEHRPFPRGGSTSRHMGMRGKRAALSLVTIAWLASLLLVGITLERGTWPISRSSMFSEGASIHVEPYLDGTTQDGRTVALTPEGLGLTKLQLRNWLAHHTKTRVDFGDGPTLQLLARAWNERHPDDEVMAVRLWRREIPLPAGQQPHSDTLLLEWEAQ
jgi:hypothetical protein